MRHMIVAAGLTAAAALLPGLAMAAPLAVPAAESGVLLVSGGCGPGGYRASNGLCYARRYMPPPPRYRRCPPGMHPSRWGCRPNY